MGLLGWFRKKSAPRDLFLEEMQDRVRGLEGVRGVSASADGFSLQVDLGEGQVSTVLENLFLEVQANPGERDARIAHFLAALVQAAAPQQQHWSEVKDRVVPVVRGPMGVAMAGHAAAPFAPCLQLHLVEDSAHGMAYLRADSLRGWGVSFDEELAVGLENLARAPELPAVTLAPGVRVLSGDDYASSRVLLPALTRQLSRQVEGTLVFAMPSRDRVLFTGDAKDEHVAALLALAEQQYVDAPRGLCSAPLTVTEAGRVVPYLREDRSPIASAVRTAHIRFQGTQYHLPASGARGPARRRWHRRVRRRLRLGAAGRWCAAELLLVGAGGRRAVAGNGPPRHRRQRWKNHPRAVGRRDAHRRHVLLARQRPVSAAAAHRSRGHGSRARGPDRGGGAREPLRAHRVSRRR